MPVPTPSSTIIWLFVVLAFVVLILSTLMFLASRYKRCSSYQILVTYGRVGKNQSARCIHGADFEPERYCYFCDKC